MMTEEFDARRAELEALRARQESADHEALLAWLKSSELTLEEAALLYRIIDIAEMQGISLDIYTALKLLKYVSSFVDSVKSFAELVCEAFQKIAKACQDTIDQLMVYGEDPDEYMKDLRRFYEPAHNWDKAPKHKPARGLSPPQKRYWVNYRARDCLPCKRLKSPAKGGKKCGER